jgi:Cd2+/Zn2+-exporting ATPase
MWHRVGIENVFGFSSEGKSDITREFGVCDDKRCASTGIKYQESQTSGSDTAIETANIALMNDKLSLLPFLVRLSKKR